MLGSPARILTGSCFAALLIAAPAAAPSGLTGNWSGTYTFSIQVSTCQSKTFSTSGNVTVTFLQTGAFLSGRMDLTSVLLFGGTCTPTMGEVTHVIAGTASGSDVAWHFPNGANGTQFTGSVDGNSITAQISDMNGGTGSVNLTRMPGDAPAVDLTGTWSGNYSFTDRCSNGATKSYSGTFTLGLTQSGGHAGGVVTMQNVPLYDQNCTTIGLLNMSLSAAGVVSGSTFSGGVFDPAGSFDFPISATIKNAAMSGTVQGASQTSTTGTFTLSQGSAQPPTADFSGSYDGSYNETDDETFFCINIASLSFSGPASISIVQAGNAISGALFLQQAEDVSSDTFGDCVVVDVGEEVLPLYGTLNGNTLTLLLPLGGGAADLFTVNFNGDTLTGTITNSFGDSASFHATRSAIAPAPVVNSFGSSPPAIVAGEPTTLSWSTSNATGVSIDNGVGSQPPSGSVTVSPARTTVYTLTATGPAGSVTAQTIVTVATSGPRRRAVRP